MRAIGITFFILIMTVFPVKSSETELSLSAIIPSDFSVAFNGKSLGDVSDILKYSRDDFLSDGEGKMIYKVIRSFKNNTGIDLLDKKIIEKSGFNLEREFYYLLFNNKAGEKGGDFSHLIFLPVNNTNTFPLKFVDIFNKSSKRGVDVDNLLKKKGEKKKEYKKLMPTITPEGDISIYQLNKDIFFCGFNGYFIISSRKNLIKRVIDLKTDNEKHSLLSRSEKYDKFLNSLNKNHRFSLYLPMEKLLENRFFLRKYNSINLSFLDYIGLSFNFNKTEMELSLLTDFNEKRYQAKILEIFLVDKIHKALAYESSTMTSFSSFDFKKFDEFFSNYPDRSVVGQYLFIKEQIRLAGVDFLDFFINNSENYFSSSGMVARDGSGKDRYITVFSLKDEEKAAMLIKMMDNFIEKKLSPEDKYQYGKVDISGKKVTSLTIGNKKSKEKVTHYIFNLNKVIYDTDSLILATDIIDGKLKSYEFTKYNPEPEIIDKNTFWFFHADLTKSKFLKESLLFETYQSSKTLYALVNRLKKIVFTGKKKNTLLELNFLLKIDND